MISAMPICRFAILVGALSTVAFGCKKPQARPELPPPAVTAIKPATASVQRYYEYNGYLDAVQMVQIQARVEGFLDEVLFKEGDDVKKNDKLYTIDPREYDVAIARAKADIARAEADIANGNAQVKLSKAEVARLTSVSKSAVSQSDIDKATATEESFKAQLGVAIANRAAGFASKQTADLKLSFTDIRSPIDGRISRTLVTPGNLVGQKEATLLTTIVSIDPIYVYFDVPERDLVEYEKKRLDPGMADKLNPRGESVVEVGISTEEGFPHIGRLDFRENRVETGTGTVRLRGILPNPKESRLLYAGLYSRVRIPAGKPQDLLVLPEEALMTGQEGTYVFALGDKDVVFKRTVKTISKAIWRAGPATDKTPPDWKLVRLGEVPAANEGAPAMPTIGSVRSVVAIESGLEPGDRVIVSGLQKARPGTAVAPEEWKLVGPAPKKP